eukprot:s11285_g3.t1
MQAFVHTNQKKLKEFLDEAAEWDRARSDARMEAGTDWELVCRIAEGSCCHGEVCSYMEAVTAFFAANAASISQNNLAAALRAIICDTSNIIGLESLAQRAYIPPGELQQLRVDLLALGVVHVRELTEDDWRGLRCWPSLLPFEQRRLLAAQAETA